VLAKHNSLMQVPDANVSGIRTMLEDQLRRHESQLRKTLTLSQRKFLQAIVNQAHFVKNVSAYDPQSGEIYGILQQMLESFEEDLSVGREDEQAAQSAYLNLTKTKEEQIKAAANKLHAKESELAQTDATLAQNQRDLSDTKKTLLADQHALTALTEGSNVTDAEYEQRKQRRFDEIAAINQALEILSAAEAHDTFPARSIHPSCRCRAPQHLRAAARCRQSCPASRTSPAARFCRRWR